MEKGNGTKSSLANSLHDGIYSRKGRRITSTPGESNGGVLTNLHDVSFLTLFYAPIFNLRNSIMFSQHRRSWLLEMSMVLRH